MGIPCKFIVAIATVYLLHLPYSTYESKKADSSIVNSQRYEKRAGGTAQNTAPPAGTRIYISPSGKSGEPDQDISHDSP